MTAEAEPCVYGRWRGEHPVTDPVEVTRISRDIGPDVPVHACRGCVPKPFSPDAAVRGDS